MIRSASALRALTRPDEQSPSETLLRHDPAVDAKSTPRAGALLDECFRTLRSQVLMHARSGLRSFALVSAQPEEGKSTVAVNLAMTLATRGRRVLLVDGDLRRPRLHRLLGLRNRGGFTDLLSSAEPLATNIQQIGNGLSVLTSGPLIADPQELLLGDRLAGVMRAMKEAYEIVLIDSAPVLSVADSALIAGHVDGVIVVIRAGVTGAADIRIMRERLTSAGGSIVGSVLNHFTGPAAKDYHPYAYAYCR